MKFTQPEADIYIPAADVPPIAALARTTHLCVAAHQDDIEIMAYHGIAACHARSDQWFSGVVVTDGAGSPRSGPYAQYTDAQMLSVRREEQRAAAKLGEYSVQIQLAHPSAAVKDPHNSSLQSDLHVIFSGCTPEIVYLHQPADKHDTHVAVFLHCLSALRALPAEKRPRRVLGCEVWRDLDWLDDRDKQALDTGQKAKLAAALLHVFASQIGGGKRYDLATVGRRLANATFHSSHAVDQFDGITWAMDLTPLVADPALSIAQYTSGLIDKFKADVAARLAKLSS